MRKLALSVLLILLAFATSASAMVLAGVLSSYRAPQAPNAPTGVTATAGNTQNTVNWSAGATDGTHDAPASYTLYGGTSASPTSSIYSGSATSYTHTGLTNGTPYYYRLTASNAAGASGYSSPDATATPASSVDMTDFDMLGNITQPGGGVVYHLSAPNSAAPANLVEQSPRNKVTAAYKVKANITAMAYDSSNQPSYRPLSVSCAATKPTTRGAAFTPNQGPDTWFIIKTDGSRWSHIGYPNTDGNFYFWTGSAWSTTPTSLFTFSLNTDYVVTLETTATQWRYTIRDSTDTSILAQSPLINWSAVKNMPTSFYLFGDLNSTLTGTTTVDVKSITVQ